MSGEVRVTQSQSHHLTDGHVLELATRECAEIVDGVDGDDKRAGFWARISEGLEPGGGSSRGDPEVTWGGVAGM